MREDDNSCANHWFLMFENQKDKNLQRPYGFYKALLFLSDKEYCVECLLKLHEVVVRWYKALESAESTIMMFLHHNNLLRNNNEKLPSTIEVSMQKYIKQEISSAVKVIHAKILRTEFLAYWQLWLGCLWEENVTYNEPFQFKFMYLSNHSFDLCVSSRDIIHWTYIAFSLTEDLYFIKNKNIQVFGEWIILVQLCNCCVQILKHISNVVESKIGNIVA